MTPHQKRKYYKEYEREYNRAEIYAYNRFKTVLTNQLKEVIANIKAKGIIATEADISNIITDTTLRAAFVDVYVKIGDQFKAFLTPRLPKQKNATLGTPSEVFGIGFFSDSFVRQMQEYATTIAGAHITSITETTRKQVKEVLSEAAGQNLSIPNTAKLMRQRLGGQFNKNRSLLIARTETTTAANYSQFLTAQNAGIRLKKEWLVRLDGRERAWHGAMNDVIVGLDEDFTVNGAKMKYPGDSRGGAANLCNCRCTVAYIPDEMEVVTEVVQSRRMFLPRATIAEAEKLAVESGLTLEANYKNVSIEAANIINKTLGELKDEYGIKAIDKINTYKKSNYVGGYVIRNEINFNGVYVDLNPRSNINQAIERLKLWQSDKEKYPQNFIGESATAKRNRKILKQLEESAKYKSFIVGPQNVSSLQATATHEFAHLLERNLFDSRTGIAQRTVYNGKLQISKDLSDEWADIYKELKTSKNGEKYQISEYAMTEPSELFAETLVLFKYEPLLLPKKILDFHLKIKKLAKENAK